MPIQSIVAAPQATKNTRQLVERLRAQLVVCLPAKLAIAGFHTLWGETSWLVWSLTDGGLLQTFPSVGEQYYVAWSDHDSAPPVLVSVSVGGNTLLSAIDVTTGVERWRRWDLRAPHEDDPADQHLHGIAGNEPVLAIRNSRYRYFLSALSGSDVIARSVVETTAPPVVVPVAFTPRSPSLSQLPCPVILDRDKYAHLRGQRPPPPAGSSASCWVGFVRHARRWQPAAK